MKEYAKCSECRKFPNVESELKKEREANYKPQHKRGIGYQRKFGDFLALKFGRKWHVRERGIRTRVVFLNILILEKVKFQRCVAHWPQCNNTLPVNN